MEDTKDTKSLRSSQSQSSDDLFSLFRQDPLKFFNKVNEKKPQSFWDDCCSIFNKDLRKGKVQTSLRYIGYFVSGANALSFSVLIRYSMQDFFQGILHAISHPNALQIFLYGSFLIVGVFLASFFTLWVLYTVSSIKLWNKVGTELAARYSFGWMKNCNQSTRGLDKKSAKKVTVLILSSYQRSVTKFLDQNPGNKLKTSIKSYLDKILKSIEPENLQDISSTENTDKLIDDIILNSNLKDDIEKDLLKERIRHQIQDSHEVFGAGKPSFQGVFSKIGQLIGTGAALANGTLAYYGMSNLGWNPVVIMFCVFSAVLSSMAMTRPLIVTFSGKLGYFLDTKGKTPSGRKRPIPYFNIGWCTFAGIASGILSYFSAQTAMLGILGYSSALSIPSFAASLSLIFGIFCSLATAVACTAIFFFPMNKKAIEYRISLKHKKKGGIKHLLKRFFSLEDDKRKRSHSLKLFILRLSGYALSLLLLVAQGSTAYKGVYNLLLKLHVPAASLSSGIGVGVLILLTAAFLLRGVSYFVACAGSIVTLADSFLITSDKDEHAKSQHFQPSKQCSLEGEVIEGDSPSNDKEANNAAQSSINTITTVPQSKLR